MNWKRSRRLLSQSLKLVAVHALKTRGICRQVPGVLPLSESSTSPTTKTSQQTRAAKYNLEMLHRLQVALKKTPEADIRSLLSPKYSDNLRLLQGQYLLCLSE